MTCRSPWYAGLTCDHLYPTCPSRLRGRAQLERSGWWDTGTDTCAWESYIDPHGGDTCGLCLHRHNHSHTEETL